jgi:signal transduction histidine kinase
MLRAEAPALGGESIGPATLSIYSGVGAEALTLRVPVQLTDTEGAVGTERIWFDRGMQAVVLMHVGAGEGLGEGLIVVGRNRPGAFDEGEVSELESLANEVSLAMASSDLLSRAQELVVLKERLNLAREIHDGLASDLSGIVALFKYYDQRAPVDPEEAQRILGQIRELADTSLASARDILTTLRPRLGATRSLAHSVRRHTDEFAKTYGITADVDVLGEESDLDPEAKDAVFQILRESLTNIRKHAEASHVHVTLDLTARPFIMLVEDDGIGVMDEGQVKVGSFGLLGMRERAELLGGSVELTNREEHGARLTFIGPSVDAPGAEP